MLYWFDPLMIDYRVMFSHIMSLQLPWHFKSTCLLDMNKCPSSMGRTEMSIGHSNVHSSKGPTEMSHCAFKCPFIHWTFQLVQWTNEHFAEVWTLFQVRHMHFLNAHTYNQNLLFFLLLAIKGTVCYILMHA